MLSFVTEVVLSSDQTVHGLYSERCLFTVVFYRQGAFCVLLMCPAFLQECFESFELKKTLAQSRKAS